MSDHATLIFTDVLAALETVVRSAPVKDLPELLGRLETVKVMGWSRAMQGSHTGQPDDQLLTIKDVAKKLQISEYRAYELARQGKLQRVCLGESVRITPEALADYIRTQGG